VNQIRFVNDRLTRIVKIQELANVIGGNIRRAVLTKRRCVTPLKFDDVYFELFPCSRPVVHCRSALPSQFDKKFFLSLFLGRATHEITLVGIN
jgi:hypothetical protein